MTLGQGLDLLEMAHGYSGCSYTTMKVLSYLLTRQGSREACAPSWKAIARAEGISRGAVSKIIRELERSGYISVSREPGMCNCYTVHTPDEVAARWEGRP